MSETNFNTSDRIEFKQGDRYYKIVISGIIIALCPDEETAKICFFALTTYKKDLNFFREQLRQQLGQQ